MKKTKKRIALASYRSFVGKYSAGSSVPAAGGYLHAFRVVSVRNERSLDGEGLHELEPGAIVEGEDGLVADDVLRALLRERARPCGCWTSVSNRNKDSNCRRGVTYSGWATLSGRSLS